MNGRRGRAGFTLVEALIGLAILGVVLVGILPAFVSYLRVNSQTDIKSGAVAAAESVMDSMRQTPVSDWDPSGSVRTVSGGDRDYQATVEYCTPTLPYCSGDARHVRVEVRYHGKVYYDVETVYTALDASFP